MQRSLEVVKYLMLRLNSLQLIYQMLVHTIYSSSRKDYYEVPLKKETKS